jgi:1,4-dihydroxy-6-naphthoate synthase
MSRKITIGFSPCPNDTFIFDALINGRLNSPFHFQPLVADVEELNEMAMVGMLDVTKLSFSAYFNIVDDYYMLRSGSALGNGVGPLLIAKDRNLPEDPSKWSVALPGQLTTAHLLFSLAYPEVSKKSFMLFSDIEKEVLSGKYDAGVIIHENRFTYQDKGLYCIQDLGDYWETNFKVPIPLGGIAAKRKLPVQDLKLIEKLIKDSTQFAFDHPEESRAFIKAYAQEMDEDVRQKHINTYVNEYSLDLGQSGEHAINILGKEAAQLFQLDLQENKFFIPTSY